MGNYFVVFRKISIFASWYSAFCWICGHTLYGCVDWNIGPSNNVWRLRVSHPVWVCGLKPSEYSRCFGCGRSHTLYGCVDWNTVLSRAEHYYLVTPCMGVWIETPLTLQICSRFLVTPCMGVWIETPECPKLPGWKPGHTLYGCVDWNRRAKRRAHTVNKSHPVWVCGLKLVSRQKNSVLKASHPVWVCGLKLELCDVSGLEYESHPVWVCGLKQLSICHGHGILGSHPVWVCGLKLTRGKINLFKLRSHPVWVCGLKRSVQEPARPVRWSHPVWVCGLKHLLRRYIIYPNWVTPCMGVWIETLAATVLSPSPRVTPCMGVWIETPMIRAGERRSISHTLYGCVDWNQSLALTLSSLIVTPCMGVWIETVLCWEDRSADCVTPCMGVWIETCWQWWWYSHD